MRRDSNGMEITIKNEELIKCDQKIIKSYFISFVSLMTIQARRHGVDWGICPPSYRKVLQFQKNCHTKSLKIPLPSKISVTITAVTVTWQPCEWIKSIKHYHHGIRHFARNQTSKYPFIIFQHLKIQAKFQFFNIYTLNF